MTIIAFDLDGTISDPAEGIAASINYSLQKLGHETRDSHLLLKYIGPRLDLVFADLLSTQEQSIITDGVAYYREHYGAIGYKQNTLYPGIETLLESLSDLNMCLYVATAKKQEIAKDVIEHFNLAQYFKAVFGCGTDKTKDELLVEIKKLEDPQKPLVMVGDRSHDMQAGKMVGAHCIGVLWGYGTAVELAEAGSDRLIDSPAELLAYLSESSTNL
ncbi:MAG: HAD hydrolase-like protein [Deltaproteobacteria bacterium]|nr:HAD hydrolase-like protein [Deltaproteobacteria bacterium]